MLKFAKAIGANTDLVTAQAFVFESSEQTLAVIISASGEDVFTKVRQETLLIEEKFSEADRLEEKFSSVVNFLKEKLKDAQELQILLAELKENTIHIQVLGDHQAYLFKENNLSKLTSSEAGQLISGFLKEGEKLLLVSSRREGSWDEQILNNLVKIPLESLEEEVESLIRDLEQPEPLAVILIENQPTTVLKPEIPSLEMDKIKQLETVVKQTEIGEDQKPNQLTSYLKKVVGILFRNRLLRIILPVALLLIVVMVISVNFYNKTQSEKNSKLAAFLATAQEKLNLAQSLKETDTQAAKQSLDEAKKNVDEVLKLSPQNKDAQNLKKELEANQTSILRIFQVSKFPEFLSLDLIKPGFSTQRMSYSLGKLLLLDDQEKSLVVLDLSKKTNQILAGSSKIGQAKLASLNGDNGFVYSDDKGLLRVDVQTQKITSVTKPDPDLGEIVDIVGFGGNVYVLDKTNNQIWKYLATSSGYSNKNPYLKQNQKADFSQSKKLQIDFSVWVQTEEILKFTAGNSDFFSIGGLDKPLKSIDNLFVSEKEDQIFILDKQNQRVVVVKKNGQYLAQYLGEKFATATDLVVDQEQKKIFLLEAGKIFTVDLK